MLCAHLNPNVKIGNLDMNQELDLIQHKTSNCELSILVEFETFYQFVFNDRNPQGPFNVLHRFRF